MEWRITIKMVVMAWGERRGHHCRQGRHGEWSTDELELNGGAGPQAQCVNMERQQTHKESKTAKMVWG